MVDNKNNIFKLYSNCQIVKGISRSIICDLNGKVFIIPTKYNEYLSLLQDERGVDAVIIENTETLRELTHELEYKQMGRYFSREMIECLPNIEAKWASPYRITNAIIDFDNIHTYNWEKFITSLDRIGCPFIQVRVFSKASFKLLNALLKLIDSTEIYSVQLIVPFDNDENFWIDLSDLIQSYPRIVDSIVYSCNSDQTIPTEYKDRIRITNEIVDGTDSCGRISPNFFTLKVDNFYESHLYNSCLNRKVSVSSDGLIRNCPSMRADYGKIDDVNLSDIIKSDKFQFWWTVKKDDIEVCKDCEFRYICSDCRVFTADISNPHSKPSKCPYDPYTCSGF